MRSPPITRLCSLPNSSRISSSAYSIRRRWAGLFLKSLKGSFLKSGSGINVPPIRTLGSTRPRYFATAWMSNDRGGCLHKKQHKYWHLRLLLQPSPPATMLFDEPELGSHPYALTLLAI